MGSFYVNFTVASDDQKAVKACLEKAECSAFISPPMDSCIVVFEEESESQDPEDIDEVGELLSTGVDAPVWCVLCHDDGVMHCILYEAGKVADRYDSCPAYFDGVGSESPEGGDAGLICKRFGRPDAAQDLESILKDDEEYVFESERHKAIVKAMGLPGIAVNTGFEYIEAGELPEGLEIEQLIRVG